MCNEETVQLNIYPNRYHFPTDIVISSRDNEIPFKVDGKHSKLCNHSTPHKFGDADYIQ